jgi:drug/metabolite transporter (DMT)-like permease
MSNTPSLPRAALWMGGWLSLMVVIAVAGREATRELAVFQVMEMRSIIGFAMLYPLLRASGGLAAVRTSRPLQHVARNVVHYAAQYGWFVALTLIPLAQVVAIEFTMPIWSALLAVAFLGERMNRGKTLAIALGVLGVGLIVRPAATGLNTGQLIALSAAVGFAVSLIMVKSLTRSDSALTIIFWMLVYQSLMGLLPAIAVWRWPSSATWGWVVVVAFCGTYSHYCMARAMQHAEATVVVPMDFLRVPLSALAGWLVYAERVDLFTVAGVTLILTGNLLNLRRAAPARPPATP